MRYYAHSVAELPPDLWRWPHVNPATEWACKKTGHIAVDEEFLDLFERLRAMYGKPLVITSGYRSPEHNAEVSTTGSQGPHTTGRAVDVAISGADAFDLIRLAQRVGITGIGLKQHGPHAGRFLHLDSLPNLPGAPRPTVWSYI